MMSPMITVPVTNPERAPKRRKRNNKKTQPAARPDPTTGSGQWKSPAQQQAYSSNLIRALRQVRPGSARTRAIHQAADRTLAVSAKGKTRWSQAILQTRLKIKFAKSKRPRVGCPTSGRAKKAKVGILRLKSKNLSAVQRKIQVLGRLVPGCQKETLPVILVEATDYIPALEMQVKALSALVEVLSGSSSSAMTE